MYTLKDLLHPATVKTKIPPSERAQQLIVIRLFHVMLILSVRRVNITAGKKKERNLVCLFIACFNCYSASFSLPQALPWSQKFLHTVDKPVSVLKCTKKKTEENILN
mgnify:FL=1